MNITCSLCRIKWKIKMTNPISEKRMLKLFELANMIASVYSSGSYNGYTGEHGASIDYPIWFEFSLQEIPGWSGNEIKIKNPHYDMIKNLREEVATKKGVTVFSLDDVVMSGKCRFGSNFMYVFWTAELTLRKMERENGLSFDQPSGKLACIESI